MSKIESAELVDLFKEEATKLSKKEQKKKEKEEKKLEKQENIAFEKLAKQEEAKQEVKEIKNDDNAISFLSEIVYGFVLVFLSLATLGYIGVNIYRGCDNRVLLQVITLGIFSFFYMLSQMLRKKKVGVFFSIISSIALCIWMALTLYFN